MGKGKFVVGGLAAAATIFGVRAAKRHSSNNTQPDDSEGYAGSNTRPDDFDEAGYSGGNSEGDF